MSQRAFVVVDMLRDFVDPDGVMYVGDDVRQIIPSIVDRLSVSRNRGDTVIFVCDNHLPDDAEFEMFPPHCVAGTPGSEVLPELEPMENELIIYKRRYSGFYGTDLDIALREKHIAHIELAGVCTNICILYTAADARSRNYEVTVCEDSVAGLSQYAHQWAISELENTLGCNVVKSEGNNGTGGSCDI